VSTVSSCFVPSIASSASRLPKGDSPPSNAQHTRWGIILAHILTAEYWQTQKVAISSIRELSITHGSLLLYCPSLTGSVVRRQVKPRPVFLLPAAHAGSLLSWKGTVTGNRKTLKVWLSVYGHVLRCASEVRTKA